MPVRSAKQPASTLASIIEPVSVREFLRTYWARKPLLIEHRNPRIYADLPTSSDFEFLLASLADARSGWFSVVKERSRLPSDAMVTEEGSANLPEVFATHAAGHSLLLNQVQKRHRGTGRFCRNLEIALTEEGVALARHIGANAYRSPPHSQGFSIHYDPHDVFICQLEGRKRWRIYKRQVEFPVAPPTGPTSPEEAGPPLMEFDLMPGDFLYIPRGFLHEARTSAESSLHLTLSVETVTWRDVFAEVMTMDPRFREALPLNFANGKTDGPHKRKAFDKLSSALAKSPYWDEALLQATRRLWTNLEPLPNGAFNSISAAAALKPNTLLGLVDGVFGRVEVEKDTAILHLPGASFRAGRHMEKSFRFLLRTPAFRPRDLPVDVDSGEKVNFMRTLVLGGYFAPRLKYAGRRRNSAIQSAKGSS